MKFAPLFLSRRKKAQLDRLVTRAVLLPIGLMLALTLFLLGQISYLIAINGQIERTDKIVLNILETQQLAVDMQTGLRGYILTKQTVFLAPYLSAQKKLSKNFIKMKQLVVDMPIQQKRATELQDQLELWEVYAQQLLELNKTGELIFPDTNFLMLGKKRMDSVRETIQLMLIEEQNTRAQASREVQFLVPMTVGSSLGIALILGGILAYLTRQELVNVTERYESILENTYIQAERLQQSAAEFRSLAEATPQFIWTAQSDGTLDYFNQRWYDFTQLTPETILDWPSVIHPNDIEYCKQQWEHSVTTGQPHELSFRLRRGIDGEYLWHLSRAVAMRNKNDQIIKWFGTITNIDEQKRSTQLLQQQTTELSRINYNLTQTGLNLEKRNHELDQFTYVISHDLKAPLRAIANLSQWIEEDLEAVLTEETHKQMNLLRGRVHRMESLINGLLQYSRVGRTPTQSQSIAVTDLVAEVVDTLAPPPGFTITISPDLPTVTTEVVLLQQVFANLIGNAIKHHHSSTGRIVISGTTNATYGEFAVSDDGPGINPDFHSKIFVIFQTLQPRDTLESTGIGLALVKKIVEDQSGKIWVESRQGAGTTFRFTWPIRGTDA